MAMVAEGPGTAGHAQRAGTVDFSDRGFHDPEPTTRDRFMVGDRIFWRARFAELPRSVRIDLVTVRRSEPGWERVVSGHELWLAHPLTPGYAGWIGPGAYDRPGQYVLRFVRGANVLAEGTFELVARADATLLH